MIYCITLLFGILIYKIKRRKIKILKILILILRIVLPFFSYFFFGQIFLFLSSTIYCNGDIIIYESQNFQCITKLSIFYTIFAIIAMVFQIILSYITNLLYYKSFFNINNSDSLKKSDSFPDIIFMFIKIIIIILFKFNKDSNNDHWIILFFLIFCTGINAYITLLYQNRKNITLMSLNNIFSLISFIGFLTLFIGKILNYFRFECLIYFFIFEIIIIFIYICYYRKQDSSFIHINYKYITNSYDYLNYINKYYMLIINMDKSRSNLIFLINLISKLEEKCCDPDCPLNKYLEKFSKGKEYKYFLFQFCNELFQYGISKFKKSIVLKYNYVVFLVIEMNNIKKASIILNTFKNNLFSFQTNYNIYKCKNLINNFNSKTINENYFIFKYTNNIYELKNLLLKGTLLQYQFLTLILGEKIKNDNNSNKLYNLGSKIIKINKKIETIFNDLIKAKINNIEIINLYSEFVEGVLEDEEKYKKCTDIKKLKYCNNTSITENNFFNFDIESLKEKYNSPYLIISADSNNLGIIKDYSITLSKMFGYQNKELIGKNINILIPEILQNPHQLIMNQLAKINKMKFYEDLSKNEIYTPDFLEKNVYGISKSKLLISLNLNIYFIKTEENELCYIIEIYQKIPLMDDKNNDEMKCCVLTNDNFLIQSFTPNSINFLKLNYYHIFNSYDIINNIKEFQDDYFFDINTTHLSKNSSIRASSIITKKNMKKNYMSLSDTKRIRLDIINKNYLKKTKVTWIINEDNYFNKIFLKTKTNILKRNSFSLNNNLLNEKLEEKEIFMEIKKIIMGKELIGYYFFFTNIIQDYSYSKFIKIHNNIFNSKKQIISKHFPFHNTNSPTNLGNMYNKSFEFIKKNTLENFQQKRNSSDKFGLKLKKRNNKYEKEIDNHKYFIKDDYIPKSHYNFAFNYRKKAYILSRNIDNGKTLNETLQWDVITKIKKYQYIKNSIIYKKQNMSSSNNNSEEPSSYNSNSESSSESESSVSLSNNGSIKNKKERESTKNGKVILKDSRITKKGNENKIIEIVDNDDIFSSYKKEIKKTDYNAVQIKTNLFNDYYKVNLDKIHFLVFDFYKENLMENNDQKISKIEDILTNLKNKKITDDEKYTINLFQKNKPKKKDEEKFENRFEQIMNDQKLLEKKISIAISNKKIEIPIMKLRIYSFICFIILIILLIICIYYFLTSYSLIKNILNLVKNSVKIKYCDRMSVFFVGESSLLYFNAYLIKGGLFEKFPAKENNKKGYIALMRTKIKESFLENQIALQQLLSSKITLTKNTTKYLTETLLNTDYIMKDGSIEITSADIFTTLMQYNGAFYNLATSPYDLEQNHNDMLNFLHNSFNDYARGINLLISVYSYELEYQVKRIKLIWILGLIVFFIIYIFIYILIIFYFISANKKREGYIELFYGVDEGILNLLIFNCEKLLKKLKKSEIKTFDDEQEDLDNISEKKNSFKKREKIFKRNSLSNKEYDQTKHKMNLSDDMINFLIFFAIILFITYGYFIFNAIFFNNLGHRANLICQFFYKVQEFHSYMIDIFIAYRQYIFDDSIIIYNMLPFEYLERTEKSSYETLTDEFKYINEFIQKFLSEDIQRMLDKNYCSYNYTDKFSSLEDCKNKLGGIINYDFSIVSSYFIEEIRINKFLVKYLLSTGNVRGNLNDYDQDIWLKDETIPKVGDNYTGENFFRLDFYNNKNIHEYIDLMFVNIILPHIDINIKYILPYLSIDDREIYLYLTSVLYLVIVILIFFIFLYIKIRNINKQIYKTKNMLSLIPINILASQNNVKELLN